MNKIIMGGVAAVLVAAGAFVYAQSDMTGSKPMDGMAMDGKPMDGMAMDGMAMDGMAPMSHASLIPPAMADDPALKAYAAAMDKMMADMMVPYTGDPDVDFAKGMIPHHQAAIDMAKVQLEFGKDPEMRALAEEVIAAQEAEIGQLKAWLAGRGL